MSASTSGLKSPNSAPLAPAPDAPIPRPKTKFIPNKPRRPPPEPPAPEIQPKKNEFNGSKRFKKYRKTAPGPQLADSTRPSPATKPSPGKEREKGDDGEEEEEGELTEFDEVHALLNDLITPVRLHRILFQPGR